MLTKTGDESELPNSVLRMKTDSEAVLDERGVAMGGESASENTSQNGECTSCRMTGMQTTPVPRADKRLDIAKDAALLYDGGEMRPG
jgi:hypothetical protein